MQTMLIDSNAMTQSRVISWEKLFLSQQKV